MASDGGRWRSRTIEGASWMPSVSVEGRGRPSTMRSSAWSIALDGHRSNVDRASVGHRHRAREGQSVASAHHSIDVRARCATTREAMSMRDACHHVATSVVAVDALVAGLAATVSSGAAMRCDDAAAHAEQRARATCERSSVHAAKPCHMRLSGKHAGSPSCRRCARARVGEGASRTSSRGARAAVAHRIVGISMRPRCDRRRGARSVSSRHAMRVSTARRACHRIDVFVIAMRAHSMA